jgi:hypothetical protein
MQLRESELRLAMHQVQDFKAGTLVYKRRVELPPHPPADVHLFEVTKGNTSKQCFAWSVSVSERETKAALVVSDERIDTAEKAVAHYFKA